MNAAGDGLPVAAPADVDAAMATWDADSTFGDVSPDIKRAMATQLLTDFAKRRKYSPY